MFLFICVGENIFAFEITRGFPQSLLNPGYFDSMCYS